jgi:YidC/Oxa1 family membrane protein insertase
VSFLNPLYHAVAVLLVGIHSGLSHVFGANSGASWALSIVLLTMAMRLVLFPVFVKQIRNQRAMQTLQPKMKELQAKYKNDKEKLNQEMMALWKENGANPLSGCLPLLLQIPIFISLFHTLREIKPRSSTCNSHLPSCFQGVPGFSQNEIFSAAHAKIFGVPISASFRTGSDLLHALGGSTGSTRVLALVLTVLMGATTFITQRQLMAQNSASGTNSQMAQQQKILLYVFPVLFLFYGFAFPIGVLLYWLTTNVWSMVQQRVVIKRMEPVAAGPTPAVAGPAPGA